MSSKWPGPMRGWPTGAAPRPWTDPAQADARTASAAPRTPQERARAVAPSQDGHGMGDALRAALDGLPAALDAGGVPRYISDRYLAEIEDG